MGKFVVFEGIDGCGKSTALEALYDYIWKKTSDSIRLGTEPTGFASGELVRKALGGKLEGISSETLLGMFLADRAIHQNEISIATVRKDWYLCDRYIYSNMAYNAKDDDDMERIEKLNSKFIQPDIVFYIDTPVEICLDRIAKRTGKKEIFENKEKLTEVKRRYDMIADSGKMIRIDGTLSERNVLEEILKVLNLR